MASELFLDLAADTRLTATEGFSFMATSFPCGQRF